MRQVYATLVFVCKDWSFGVRCATRMECAKRNSKSMKTMRIVLSFFDWVPGVARIQSHWIFKLMCYYFTLRKTSVIWLPLQPQAAPIITLTYINRNELMSIQFFFIVIVLAVQCSLLQPEYTLTDLKWFRRSTWRCLSCGSKWKTLVQCSWWSYCCRIAFTLTVFISSFIHSISVDLYLDSSQMHSICMSKWAPIVTHFFRIRRCRFNDFYIWFTGIAFEFARVLTL